MGKEQLSNWDFLRQQQGEARQLWHDGNEVQIKHKNMPVAEPAYAFLFRASEHAGNNQPNVLQSLEQVFDAQSNFILNRTEAFRPIDLVHCSCDQLDEALRARTKPAMDLIDPSLYEGHMPNTFNRHGATHIDDVTKNARQITREVLTKLGYSAKAIEREEKIAIMEARLHDMFCLISRHDHPTGSAELVKVFLPELTNPEFEQNPFWRNAYLRVRQGIMLHDEKTARRRMASLRRRFQQLWEEREGLLAKKKAGSMLLAAEAFRLVRLNKTLPADEYVAIRRWYGVPELALVLADKRKNIDRDRVTRSVKVGSTEAAEDVHTELAQVFKTAEPKKVRRRYIKTLLFEPTLKDPREKIELQHRTVKKLNGKEPVQVARATHENHSIGGYPHFLTLVAKFGKEFSSRMQVEAEAVFALYPEINRFEVVFTEKTALAETGFGLSAAFWVMRGMTDQFAAFIDNNVAYNAAGATVTDRFPVSFQNTVTRVKEQTLKLFTAGLNHHQKKLTFNVNGSSDPMGVSISCHINPTEGKRSMVTAQFQRLFVPRNGPEQKGNK